MSLWIERSFEPLTVWVFRCLRWKTSSFSNKGWWNISYNLFPFRRSTRHLQKDKNTAKIQVHKHMTQISTWLDLRKSKDGDLRKFRPRYHLNIVQEPSQWYVRMSNTEAMYTKTCNRCSAMMNKQTQFSSLSTMVNHKVTNICHCGILPWKWYAHSNTIKIHI